ncbi:MAG: chemotaxis protein CheX [Methylovulum sp.]|nr:chemotaxis protein CheX [Methylovulum sp.]
MSDESQLVCKVLVIDTSPEYFDQIKQFCDQNGLIGLRVLSPNIMAILSSNVDLGAILLAEDYYDSLDDVMVLAQQINIARPELPIVLRRTLPSHFDSQPEQLRKLFCATYTIDDMTPLRKVIDEYIFSIVYPNALVRGISEISISTLASQFQHLTISTETPYIVRDRIIFGELFSLIQLESSWCRGYMMLQTEEGAILDVLRTDDDLNVGDGSATFRTVNSILGEVTNVIWGAFKNRFIANDDLGIRSTSQVPIVINHQHKYISFGSENPQLCFKYTLSDERNSHFISIYQWFVFNLYWSPDDFKEIQTSVDDFIDLGELELF